MTIFPIKAFGQVLIPEAEYQDLVSGNETKGDRIDELTQSMQILKNSNRAIVTEFESASQALRDRAEDLNRKIENRDEQIEMMREHLESEQRSSKESTQEIETISDRQRAEITELHCQVKQLQESESRCEMFLDDTHKEKNRIFVELQAVKQELTAIQKDYSKTQAINAELYLKLEKAIADSSKSEQQYNELIVIANQQKTLNKIAVQRYRDDAIALLDNLSRAAS